MTFYPIEENVKVYPGEYVLHVPSHRIVLCGAFIPTKGILKGMVQGGLIEDKIENFNKIKMTRKEHQEKIGGCNGCKG